jgi:CBS domain-containing protein
MAQAQLSPWAARTRARLEPGPARRLERHLEQRGWEWSIMKVRDGMTRLVLTIGPAHTLREAAHLMSVRRVGAAVVMDSEHAGIGILTERDILDSIGAGQDPDTEVAAQHRTEHVVFATPDWTLQRAAETMVSAGFRHLVVVEGNEVTGLLSMRDIVRCWAGSDTPARGEQVTATA